MWSGKETNLSLSLPIYFPFQNAPIQSQGRGCRMEYLLPLKPTTDKMYKSDISRATNHFLQCRGIGKAGIKLRGNKQCGNQ